MNNKKNIALILIAVVLVFVGWLIFRNPAPTAETENIYENIVGEWRGVEYPDLVREFKEGGVVTDSFGSEEVANGTWETFTSATAPEEVSSLSLDEEAVYLRMTLTGEERDMIYFEVLSATAEDLELLYLSSATAGVLEFERVVEEVPAE